MLTDLDRGLDAAIAAATAPGGQLAVGRAVVDGVDLPVFVNAPASLREYLAFFSAANGDKEFLITADERLTFAEVWRRAMGVAAALQARHGVAKGDRVAIAMRNHAEWVTCFFGCAVLGAVAVPLNAWWTGDELFYGLADSGARVAIVDEERLRRLAALGRPLPILLSVRVDDATATELGATPLDAASGGESMFPYRLPPIVPEDDATIMYTSGSTGAPKGAVSTHRGVVSATLNYLVNVVAMLELAVKSGVQPAPPVMLLNVPLFHITGLVPVLLVSVAMGRKLVLMHKWEPGEALRLIAAEKCTYFVGVPTMSLELMQHPERDRHDLSSLLDIAAGGAPRPPEHVARLAEAFPGKFAALGYGLTETNGVGAGNLRQNYMAKPDSTGRASAPLVEFRIANDDMSEVAVGGIGEICIRSVANVRGYWNKPEATAAAFTRDGWFRTGDLGRLDEDGYLFIVDRKKDIIIRGGENIGCTEVEAAIYAHPAVAEASVFGLPDERLGEIVGAVAHLKAGETVTPGALTEFVAGRIAAFKVPARLWVQAEPLPKLAAGKIDKVTLRSEYRAVHAEARVAAE